MAKLSKAKKCRRLADDVVPQGRKSFLWKDTYDVCMTYGTAGQRRRRRKRGGLGYVAKAAGSPQYVWKRKRR